MQSPLQISQTPIEMGSKIQYAWQDSNLRPTV
jgi:hypothetical protein